MKSAKHEKLDQGLTKEHLLGCERMAMNESYAYEVMGYLEDCFLKDLFIIS